MFRYFSRLSSGKVELFSSSPPAFFSFSDSLLDDFDLTGIVPVNDSVGSLRRT